MHMLTCYIHHGLPWQEVILTLAKSKISTNNPAQPFLGTNGAQQYQCVIPFLGVCIPSPHQSNPAAWMESMHSVLVLF